MLVLCSRRADIHDHVLCADKDDMYMRKEVSFVCESHIGIRNSKLFYNSRRRCSGLYAKLCDDAHDAVLKSSLFKTAPILVMFRFRNIDRGHSEQYWLNSFRLEVLGPPP